MPNRILRDGVVKSKRFNRMSPGAQLFWYKLVSVVDDYGRFEADTLILRAAVFPLQIDIIKCTEVAGWLNECQEVYSGIEDDWALLSVYEVKGSKYLQINEFRQRERKEKDGSLKASRYPDPSRAPSAATCREVPPLAARASNTNTNTNSVDFISERIQKRARGEIVPVESQRPAPFPELPPHDAWIVVAEAMKIYKAAGVPVPPKHEQLAVQLVVEIDPGRRYRLLDYIKHMLLIGKWRDARTTKSLLNLLRDGDWDVEIIPRTLGAPPGQLRESASDEAQRIATERFVAKQGGSG